MRPMTRPTILPDPQQLRVCALSAEAETITAVVEPTAMSCTCPVCGHEAARVHSRYTRQLADLPWHGVAFRLQLRSRKFFCDMPTCPRQIFTQRFPDVVVPYARRTQRLAQLLELVAALVGGAPGLRLLRAAGVPGVRRDTLLRLVRRAVPAAAHAPATVVGIDGFSWRRGRTFGTILVDLARHQVIDLLPTATVEEAQTWLAAHPQLQVVSRDRAGVYTQGARLGAPQAQQVADRWHLCKKPGGCARDAPGTAPLGITCAHSAPDLNSTALSVGHSPAAPSAPDRPTQGVRLPAPRAVRSSETSGRSGLESSPPTCS